MERTAPEPRELVDALLGASRALVAMAIRSLSASGHDITLPQYRVLALLRSEGPHRVAELADCLGVSPPNATRICTRLGQKGLVRRTRSSRDRRAVRISLSPVGREVVEKVSALRREELGRIVGQISVEDRDRLVGALKGFSVAAGEVPEDGWDVEWGQ